LTGRVPFEGGAEQGTDSDFLVKQAHVQMTPSSPQRIRPEIPDHVARAVLKAMRKDPAQRFQTCTEFTQALELKMSTASPPDLAHGGSLVKSPDLKPSLEQRTSGAAVALPMASLRSRFWASVIDNLLLILVALIPIMLLLKELDETTAGIIFTIIFTIIYLIYETTMLTSSGQTLGKKYMGIKVVSVDGLPISSGKAFGRSLTRGLLNLIPTVGGLIDVVPIFSDRKQCIHDKVAQTFVVRCG